MLPLLLIAWVDAAPLADRERLEWTVSWMGLDAGTAWATLRATEGGWTVEAGCRSAEWLGSLYPIDDWLLSEWSPVGATRYRTRFREGRFHQDQDMRFGADALVVSRTQWVDGAWKSSEDRHPAAPGLLDPVAAFYRVREVAPEPGERTTLALWTGRRQAPARLTGLRRELVDGVASRVVEVATLDGEDVRGRVTMWIGDDADRVPLAAEFDTQAGPVRVQLSSRAWAR